MEIFPSLAQVTGARLPEDVVLDGYNWWPTLCGETESPRSEMFWKRKDLLGARVGSWKWGDMGGKGGGLFNLEEDIGERKDLSDEYPEVLARVKGRFDQWMEEMEKAEPRGPFKDF